MELRRAIEKGAVQEVKVWEYTTKGSKSITMEGLSAALNASTRSGRAVAQ